MENQRSTDVADRALQSHAISWNWFEKRVASAFMLAGTLLVASIVVPVALKTVTDWAWVSGIVLVGLGVVAVAAGLFGLYPRTQDHTPRVATVGVLSGVIAGAAALGLIAMGGFALIGEGAFGMDLGKPMGVFMVVTLSMAGGFSLGFLSFGIAGWRTEAISRTTSELLLLGGAVLLVPVASEILRRGIGIEIGIPPWIFLPVLGLVILDTLVIGYVLRTET